MIHFILWRTPAVAPGRFPGAAAGPERWRAGASHIEAPDHGCIASSRHNMTQRFLGGSAGWVNLSRKVDNGEHKVVAFGRDGKERFRLGSNGQQTGQFNIPLAETTGADCALYVADSGNFRIQKFDANGNFLLAFGVSGPAISKAVGTQWQRPAKPPQLPVTPR